VAKKKSDKTRQINVRMPTDLADRLDKAAEMLATDSSHLLRMILVEKLPEYEDRGRRARGLAQEGTQ
jgi:predicted DNA-binding protein